MNIYSNLKYLNELLKVELIEIKLLKPHEKYCPKKLDYWLHHIHQQNEWTTPILVESDNKIIMDGHHRFEIAKILGLQYIPAIITSYANPYLTIGSFNATCPFNPEQIIYAGTCGILMEKKSTRHILQIQLPKINIPLKFLY